MKSKLFRLLSSLLRSLLILLCVFAALNTLVRHSVGTIKTLHADDSSIPSLETNTSYFDGVDFIVTTEDSLLQTKDRRLIATLTPEAGTVNLLTDLKPLRSFRSHAVVRPHYIHPEVASLSVSISTVDQSARGIVNVGEDENLDLDFGLFDSCEFYSYELQAFSGPNGTGQHLGDRYVVNFYFLLGCEQFLINALRNRFSTVTSLGKTMWTHEHHPVFDGVDVMRDGRRIATLTPLVGRVYFSAGPRDASLCNAAHPCSVRPHRITATPEHYNAVRSIGLDLYDVSFDTIGSIVANSNSKKNVTPTDLDLTFDAQPCQYYAVNLQAFSEPNGAGGSFISGPYMVELTFFRGSNSYHPC